MIEKIGGMSALSPSSAGALPGAEKTAAVSGRDFGEVLKEAASDAIGTMHKSEAVAMEAIQGRASLQEVVDKVMEAERTLATAMAIRNKAVAAWQEISRMQI